MKSLTEEEKKSYTTENRCEKRKITSALHLPNAFTI